MAARAAAQLEEKRLTRFLQIERVVDMLHQVGDVLEGE
jgi:hypothetical protein